MDRPAPPSSRSSADIAAATPQQIHIHNHPPRGRWIVRILVVLLLVSVVFNLTQLAAYKDHMSLGGPPYESFVDGEASSPSKIAVLEINSAIIPPFSDRVLETIDRIEEDDAVKGVVVAIDSPGGLVVDSHRIYKRIKELREKKPMVVSFERLAASGGYYSAMGAGPESTIFVEEAGWTGSIGVIIPRFDMSELSNKIGIESDSLKTGALKGSLDPFEPLSDQERKVWETILDESLSEFVRVIDEGRADLSEDQIRQYATGQIFTASQSIDLKLADKLGDRDDAIEHLKLQLKLSNARIVEYDYPVGLTEALLGAQAEAERAAPLKRLLDANTPRAMYYFGWDTGLMP